jgi:hypothetical protein
VSVSPDAALFARSNALNLLTYLLETNEDVKRIACEYREQIFDESISDSDLRVATTMFKAAAKPRAGQLPFLALPAGMSENRDPPMFKSTNKHVPLIDEIIVHV